METFTTIGEAMAGLTAQVVSGDGSAPSRVATAAHPVVDWRQM